MRQHRRAMRAARHGHRMCLVIRPVRASTPITRQRRRRPQGRRENELSRITSAVRLASA
jgi:hypothetical protein